MSKWAPLLLILALIVPTTIQAQDVKVEDPLISPPVLENPPEDPAAGASSAISIRKAVELQIAEQLTGRKARLFKNRDRYRERLIDETIDRAIVSGILDPQDAFQAPQVVVAEIMGNQAEAAQDGRPARDWAGFFQALKPFLEWFLELLAGLGAFG